MWRRTKKKEMTGGFTTSLLQNSKNSRSNRYFPKGLNSKTYTSESPPSKKRFSKFSTSKSHNYFTMNAVFSSR